MISKANNSDNYNFIKVRNHLTINRALDITSDGAFSQEFKERLNDADEFVRSKIIIHINETVGLHNWALSLIQHYDRHFFCDIYCDDKNSFGSIVSLISNKLTEIEIEDFKYIGTTADYRSGK